MVKHVYASMRKFADFLHSHPFSVRVAPLNLDNRTIVSFILTEIRFVTRPIITR